MVEDAAFDLARAEGGDAITVRRIAQQLGTSTQPVYTACGSIAAVRAAVAARAKAFAEGYLRIGSASEPPFLQIGLGALRFAHDQPHLFRLAGEHMRSRLGEGPPPPVAAAMRADPMLADLPDERLRQLHVLMWIFSQGLAPMVQHDAGPDALRQAEAYLRMAGSAIAASVLEPVPKPA